MVQARGQERCRVMCAAHAFALARVMLTGNGCVGFRWNIGELGCVFHSSGRRQKNPLGVLVVTEVVLVTVDVPYLTTVGRKQLTLRVF